MNTIKKADKDIAMKEFWRDNARFADLFNAVLFEGKEMIKAGQLNELDTDMSGTIQWKNGYSMLKRTRDIVKKEYNGVEFNILGLEIQNKIHYAMPLRTMIYDGLGYLKEYNELKRKNKEKGSVTPEEFLSGMNKEDRLHPIITIVLYCSEKIWDGPCCIKDMMIDMPAEYEKIFTDYRMNLVQIRNSDKYNFHNEEVKDVFRITSAIYDERYDVIYKDYKDKNISLEVLNIISVITETAEVLEIVENTSSEKGINMCEALKKLQDESKKEERINSIMSMLDFGVTKEQILTRYSEEEYNMARKNLIKNK